MNGGTTYEVVDGRTVGPLKKQPDGQSYKLVAEDGTEYVPSPFGHKIIPVEAINGEKDETPVVETEDEAKERALREELALAAEEADQTEPAAEAPEATTVETPAAEGDVEASADNGGEEGAAA